MATVWLARDLRLDRPVAIKVLHEALSGVIGADRFAREVRVLTHLRHPGIVPVLDAGVIPAEGSRPALPWYAMDFVAGETLRERLARERQLPVDEALRITEEIAGALQAAHQVGIIHRDIKPENVILAEGRTFVVDFGIARLVEVGGDRLTSTGIAVGTPAYMSPEQASADLLDPKTDQYSLAVLTYEMLVGEPPFTGPTAQAIAARRMAEAARPVRPVRPTVPAAVEEAVLRGLERVPADRYPDVAAFAKALRSPVTNSSSSARAGARWPAALFAAFLILVGLGAWRLMRPGNMAGRTADPTGSALYQRGKRAYDRRTQEGAREAIADFSAAVKLDSTYTPALTGLAKTYIRAIGRYFIIEGLSQDSMLQLAVVASGRALAADSANPDVLVTRAVVSGFVDPTETAPEIRLLRRALAIDSSYAPAWHFLANNEAGAGDFDAAIGDWRRSVRADPSYTQGVAFMAIAHYWRRQYDSAAVWADSTIAIDPTFILGRSVSGEVAIERRDYVRAIAAFEATRRLDSGVEQVNALAGRALAEGRAGKVDAARSTLRQADSLASFYNPVPLHTAVYIAHAYAALGEPDRSLDWLARYEPQGDVHFQLHLRCDPPFDPIENDRRFQALLTIPRPEKGKGC